MTSTAPVDSRANPTRGAKSGRMGSWVRVITRSGRLPAFLVACGCLVLLYGFLLSGDFAVNDVTVRGAQLGDPRDIAGSTGAFGVSVFEVEPDTIASRLSGLPYIERVEVETRLPSQVVVTLRERTPVVVWVTDDGSYLVDAFGRVLMPGEAPELPGVEAQGFEIRAGETIDPERIAAVDVVCQELGTQLDELAWNEREGLTARLDDKRLVIFGQPERLPMKLAVYQEFRTMDLSWSVLDLREPDRPYYE